MNLVELDNNNIRNNKYNSRNINDINSDNKILSRTLIFEILSIYI